MNPEHEYHNEACGCMPPPPEPVTVTVQDADLGASKPVPQPVYKTRPTQHSTVVACGHKLETGHFPRQANCEHCWFALFETTPDGVASVHDLLLREGTQAVIAMHGSKFTKQFGKYLQKKLLSKYRASDSYASGIEGNIMDLSRIEHCRENG
jgi:hypothetical protein